MVSAPQGDGTFYVPILSFLAGTNYGWDENLWTTIPGDFTGVCRTSIVRASAKFLHMYTPDGTNLDCWHKDGFVNKSCVKRTAFVYVACAALTNASLCSSLSLSALLLQIS